jgi:hypothetical protein
MALLQLVQADTGTYFLQGTEDPSRNADFSLYDWDGEGGDPFTFGNQKWSIVEGLPSVEYDPDDQDSWWNAQMVIVAAAEAAGIAVPPYAKE